MLRFLLIISLITTKYVSSELTIGALFDENDEQQKKTFEIATKLANERRTADEQLKIIVETLAPFNMFEAATKCCHLIESGAVAIFGPANRFNFEAIQSVCDAKEIPVIQTRWNHRPQRDSSIINFHPHPPQIARAYIEIIRQLRWTQFALLYDDEESFMRLVELMKLSQDKQYFVLTRELDPNKNGIYRRQLKDIASSDVKNIIVDCRTEILSRVLEQAQQIGLMNRNYNYFITNFDFHTLDLEPFRYSNTNITSIRLVKPELTRDLRDELCARTEQSGEQIENCVATSSALVSDAVFMLEQGLNELETGSNMRHTSASCNNTSTWKYGSTLINMIKTKKTDGITGSIRFDNEGFRSDFTLEIAELHEFGLVDIGHWNVSDGVQIKRPVFHEDTEVLIDDDPSSLANKTLVVITALTEPYCFLKDTSERLTGNDRYEGFGVDLIDEMAKLERFKYVITLRADKSNGARNEHGQWSGMIGDLINHTADLAIADLTINSERANAVDFTTPFMELGIKILFQKPTAAPPNFFSFAEPFAADTWLSIAVSYIFVSISLFIMGRLSASEWTNPFPCIEEPEYLINQFSMSNSFWFSTGAGLQQGTEIAPIAMSTRMVAGLWWFFILLMVSSYTANLASFLATQMPLTLFTDVESLVNNAERLNIRYGAKAEGATEKFFRDSKDHPVYGRIYKRMQEHREDMPNDNKDGVNLAETTKYAFFMESLSIEYETERHCGLEMYGDYLDHKGYGIAMRKNSTYRSRLSTTILKLQSSGVIDDLKRKWWQERRGGGQCTDASGDTGEADPLGLSNLEGVFFVTVYGVIGGFVFAIVERSMHVMAISRKTRMPFVKALKHELKFYVNFDSNVKPVLGSNANLAEGDGGERPNSSSEQLNE